MKLGELLIRLGITKAELQPGISRDCVVILMAEESDGYNIENVTYFQKEGQMWLTFDDTQPEWFSTEEEEDGGGPPDDDPVLEREGDMCCLPEVSGDRCTNPFCINGQTELGSCLICNPTTKQQEKPDVCQQSRHKAKRA